MSEVPQTRYAKRRDVFVAYQSWGSGDTPLLLITEWSIPLDIRWERTETAGPLRRLGSFARVASFDRSGIGCSDPAPLDASTPEGWMDDALAVLDELGWERTAVLGAHDGGLVAMLLAATYPGRVTALVLVNTGARLTRAPDYRIGIPRQLFEDRAAFEPGPHTQGGSEIASLHVGVQLADWYMRYRRMQASPTTMAAYNRMIVDADVRGVLTSIQAPTLVVHRRDNAYWRIDHGRFLADHIPGAQLAEAVGRENLWWAGDPTEALDEIEAFLTGTRPVPPTDRVLATVLITDIVGSTSTVAEVGDRRWRELLTHHREIAVRQIDAHGGRFINSIGRGDGVLATFDGPARAVRCALAIREQAGELGVRIRAGLHTGEVELSGEDIAGIAVHIADRVTALAQPGQVLVSRTVPDLVAGSGLEFAERGVHDLKGVPRAWELYEVVS